MTGASVRGTLDPHAASRDNLHQVGHTLSALLRRPDDIVTRCGLGHRLQELTATSLATTTAGAAVFGAVIGASRGDAQIFYSAIKLPLALLATLLVATPAFHAFSTVLGRPARLRYMVALTLSATARASLILIALCPLLWLFVSLELGYHRMILVSALAYSVAGIGALSLLLKGLHAERGKRIAAFLVVGVFLLAGGQSAWILRPYIGRPAQAEVPFLRSPEGGFGDSLYRSLRSGGGIYDRIPSAELVPEGLLPGEVSYNPAVREAFYELSTGRGLDGQISPAEARTP